MGMSTTVYGIKPADKKYKAMEKIYHLCDNQGVRIPDEVDKFFDGETPDKKGVVIPFSNLNGIKSGCERFAATYNADMEDGFEIKIDQLPKDIKIIRFVNSY